MYCLVAAVRICCLIEHEQSHYQSRKMNPQWVAIGKQKNDSLMLYQTTDTGYKEL